MSTKVLDLKYTILEASIKHLAKVGPAQFEVRKVCSETNSNPTMVHYYFTNREELIKITAVESYKRYVNHINELNEDFNLSIEERLETWITRQIGWTIANPGIAMVLNYPSLTLFNNSPNDDAKYLEIFQEYSTRNLSSLGKLILELLNVKVSSEENLEQTMKSFPEIAIHVGHIGWLTFGISIWSAGEHAPTRYLRETNFDPRKLIEPLFKKLITEIKLSVENL